MVYGLNEMQIFGCLGITLFSKCEYIKRIGLVVFYGLIGDGCSNQLAGN